MFNKPDYTYRAEVIRVIDGDTVDVNIDLGFYMKVRKRLRLLDLDTEEVRGGTDESKARAKEATERMKELLASGTVYVQTEMDATGKYGRLLAAIYVDTAGENEIENFVNVNQTMVTEGYQKII